MRHRSYLRPALVLTLAALTAAAPARAQVTVPTGFADSLVVTSLDEPVGLAFVPGSTAAHARLVFVEQRTARVRLLIDGVLSPTDPVGVVPEVESASPERGLLSIAVDPRWPASPFAYVWYTSTTGQARLSRFTLDGDLSHAGSGALSFDSATRYDLLTTVPDVAANHNGGALRFGPDGDLYVSIGDDASGCGAQDSISLRGVILRLDVRNLPAGAGGPPVKSLLVAAGNPFAASVNLNERLVWALGFRNPFRFQVDPLGGALYVADVGQDDWEELDEVGPADDAGWPMFEGDSLGIYPTCPGSATGLLSPIAKIPHPTGEAIMCLGVVRRDLNAPWAFPAGYEGDVFYSDYYGGMIRRLHWDGLQWTSPAAPGQPSAWDWGQGAQTVCDALFGPDGGLWYVRQAADLGYPAMSGRIGRIAPGTPSPLPPGPARGALLAPRPNPSRGRCDLPFRLAVAGRARLRIYDVRGRLVRTLLDRDLSAGPDVRTWDGADESGRRAPQGFYLVRLEVAGAEVGSRRISLVR